MKRFLNIFRIKAEERGLALVTLITLVILNTLAVIPHWQQYTHTTENIRKMVLRTFHLSGFDPLTYIGITEWTTVYNIYRHPLLAFFIWPLAMINKGIILLTGFNASIILTTLAVIFCGFYSVIFIYRIMREVIGLHRVESNVMVALTFSFAFIILSAMAPDHFIMSMFALTLTLYLSGKKLQKSSALNMWQTICLFLLTAGISLNNGLKVFLAALFTRRKRFFEWKYLLLSVIIPSALIWGFARWEYQVFEAPKYRARQEAKMKRNEKLTEDIRRSIADTISVKDSALIEKEVKKVVKQRAIAKKRRDDMRAVVRHTGKPIAKGEFIEWTDVTTSRWDTAVENLFGEGIQLHENYLLGDVLVNRPVIVRYVNWLCYIVEGIIVLLFLIGIWLGRRRLFLWTALSFMMMDMAVHMVLGFGINEIYIMSAHYLFVLPIAMACILTAMSNEKHRRWLTIGIGVLSVWCWIWNITLLIQYLFFL